jgi:hypothetical protein
MTFRLASLKKSLIALPLFVFMLAPLANADTFNLNLSYALNSRASISNVATFNRYTNGGGIWWPTSVPAGASTIIDPFMKSTDNMPLWGLILGLTSDSHLVAMVDSTASLTWPSGGYTESAVTGALAYFTTFDRDLLSKEDQGKWDDSLQLVSDFVNDMSIWFSMGTFDPNPPTTPGQFTTNDFKIVDLSAGLEIGNGTARMDYNPPRNVPEPSSILLLGIGLSSMALAGGASRNRQPR